MKLHKLGLPFICSALAFAPLSIQAEQTSFQDVPADAWYISYINQALEQGFMHGYGDGRFGPQDSLSRGQVAQMIYNYLKGTPGSKETFPDTAGSWYHDAASFCKEQGILTGYANGTFGGSNLISRQDFMVTLFRLADKLALLKEAGSVLSEHPDANLAGSYAINALNWGMEQGIIGSSLFLNPTSTATRAEAAKMLVSWVQAFQRQKRIQTDANPVQSVTRYLENVTFKPESGTGLVQLDFSDKLASFTTNKTTTESPFSLSNVTQNGKTYTGIIRFENLDGKSITSPFTLSLKTNAENQPSCVQLVLDSSALSQFGLGSKSTLLSDNVTLFHFEQAQEFQALNQIIGRVVLDSQENTGFTSLSFKEDGSLNIEKSNGSYENTSWTLLDADWSLDPEAENQPVLEGTIQIASLPVSSNKQSSTKLLVQAFNQAGKGVLRLTPDNQTTNGSWVLENTLPQSLSISKNLSQSTEKVSSFLQNASFSGSQSISQALFNRGNLSLKIAGKTIESPFKVLAFDEVLDKKETAYPQVSAYKGYVELESLTLPDGNAISQIPLAMEIQTADSNKQVKLVLSFDGARNNEQEKALKLAGLWNTSSILSGSDLSLFKERIDQQQKKEHMSSLVSQYSRFISEINGISRPGHVSQAEFDGVKSLALNNEQIAKIRQYNPHGTIKDSFYQSFQNMDSFETPYSITLRNLWQLPYEYLWRLFEDWDLFEFTMSYLEQDKYHNYPQTISESLDSVPLLIQWDLRWAWHPYGNLNVAWAGCAPTSISMIYSYLLQDPSLTPWRIAETAEQLGMYVIGSGSSNQIFEKTAGYYGLHCQSLGISRQAIENALQSGQPVVLNMTRGIFTRGGHFIVATRSENGLWKINDPNSISRSQVLWDPALLLSQCAAAWSFWR